MPVSFLSTTQRERYGLYPESLTNDELARYFHLDDDDREWIAAKRRDSSRLGYALQLATVRFLGTFLEDPMAVPEVVLHTLSTQLGIADVCQFKLALYRPARRPAVGPVQVNAPAWGGSRAGPGCDVTRG